MKRLLLLVVLCSPAWATYAYRATITVPHGLVGNGAEDEMNFPVLVKATDASFALAANGGQIQNTGTPWTGAQVAPYDLIFTTDASCSSIAGVNGWEIDSYSGAATTSVTLTPIIL
jgi:hypothetical protein